MTDLVYRVIWGGLDLTDAPFGFEFGADWGAPQSAVEVIDSLLQDGEIEISPRDSNRTISFSVLVEGGDLHALAKAEELLAAQARKQRNEILVDPGDGWAAPFVLTTFKASVTQPRDDEAERQGYRRFNLTMQARPFVRSANPVVIEAIADGQTPSTPVTDTVDDCSVVGGWSRETTEAVSAHDGRIEVVKGSPRPDRSISLRVNRAGVFSLTGTPYLVFDVALLAGESAYWSTARLSVNGGELNTADIAAGLFMDPVAVGPSPTPGMTRLWYKPGPTSITTLQLRVGVIAREENLPAFYGAFQIDKVSRTNEPPYVGTGRQQFRSLLVPGSARTEGSIQIAHETSSLGDVVVYTNADDGSGYQPPCRQYRSAGGSITVDPTTASGALSPLNTSVPETYDVPAHAVPDGSYSIMARVQAAVAGYTTLTLNVSTLMGSTELGTVTSNTIVNLTTGLQLVELAAEALPVVPVAPGSVAKVRLKLSCPTDVKVDDTYIFNTTVGALSIVSCGTGTPTTGGDSNRLWIETATLERPHPSMWVGTLADKSDRRHVSATNNVRSEMPHQLVPGDVNLFTLCSNAEQAAASAELYPNWYFHAAS